MGNISIKLIRRAKLAISFWPEGEGIVSLRKKIPFNYQNITMEEGSANNMEKDQPTSWSKAEKMEGKLYILPMNPG